MDGELSRCDCRCLVERTDRSYQLKETNYY
jgi:hypothetical protein